MLSRRIYRWLLVAVLMAVLGGLGTYLNLRGREGLADPADAASADAAHRERTRYAQSCRHPVGSLTKVPCEWPWLVLCRHDFELRPSPSGRRVQLPHAGSQCCHDARLTRLAGELERIGIVMACESNRVFDPLDLEILSILTARGLRLKKTSLRLMQNLRSCCIGS